MKTKNNKPVFGRLFLRWLNIATCLLLGLHECSAQVGHDKRNTKSGQISFSIISNKVVENADIGYVSRYIHLMIDPADFTEAKLRKLLDHLFNKYQTPHQLSVYLHSHPIQLRDFGMLEQTKPNDEARKYPYGRLSRIDGKEEISYTLPSSREWNTIVVKERKSLN